MKIYNIEDVLIRIQDVLYCPYDVVGDGNCFYRALNLDIRVIRMCHCNAYELRVYLIDKVLALIETDREVGVAMERYWDSIHSIEAFDTLKEYLEHARMDGVWTRSLEINLFSLVLGMNIKNILSYAHGKLIKSKSKEWIDSFGITYNNFVSDDEEVLLYYHCYGITFMDEILNIVNSMMLNPNHFAYLNDQQ